MTFTQPVSWGRTLAEYRAMFALGSADDSSRVLDVAAGPASFAAEWTIAGRRVVACDPLYALGEAGMRERLAHARSAMRELLTAHAERFSWRTFSSPDELIAARLAAAERFFADIKRGKVEGRYVAGVLPNLPFADRAFDLGLCSHLLFLYSEALDADFHVAALTELARVAREVRVFPLLTIDGRRSPHLPSVTARLQRDGYCVAVERVAYEVLLGANEVLRLERKQ